MLLFLSFPNLLKISFSNSNVFYIFVALGLTGIDRASKYYRQGVATGFCCKQLNGKPELSSVGIEDILAHVEANTVEYKLAA
jgi:hypothetical protein